MLFKLHINPSTLTCILFPFVSFRFFIPTCSFHPQSRFPEGETNSPKPTLELVAGLLEASSVLLRRHAEDFGEDELGSLGNKPEFALGQSSSSSSWLWLTQTQTTRKLRAFWRFQQTFPFLFDFSIMLKQKHPGFGACQL